MPRDRRNTSILRTIRKAAQKDGVLDRLASNLTRSERTQLRKSFGGLDSRFLLEKADLIKDTMSEILRNRRKTPNHLLQRNVFSSLDAIALHLDASGFASVFQRLGPKMLKGIPFDDTQIVNFEYELLLNVMGGKEQVASLGLLSFTDVEEVFAYAQKHRSGAHGVRRLQRKDFSFRQMMAESCGRPDKMLDIVIHSPQAWKVVVAIAFIVVNIVAGIAAVVGLIFPLVGEVLGAAGVVTCIATLVIAFVVVGAGC